MDASGTRSTGSQGWFHIRLLSKDCFPPSHTFPSHSSEREVVGKHEAKSHSWTFSSFSALRHFATSYPPPWSPWWRSSLCCVPHTIWNYYSCCVPAARPQAPFCILYTRDCWDYWWRCLCFGLVVIDGCGLLAIQTNVFSVLLPEFERALKANADCWGAEAWPYRVHTGNVVTPGWLFGFPAVHSYSAPWAPGCVRFSLTSVAHNSHKDFHKDVLREGSGLNVSGHLHKRVCSDAPGNTLMYMKTACTVIDW